MRTKLLRGVEKNYFIYFRNSVIKKIYIIKLDVENVLIISAIEQYNPLYKFEIYNFRIIVERAKDLLNNLYTRVVQSDVSSSDEIVKFQPSNIYG